MHLLCAEDNPTNQFVLRRLLESLGHSCDIVHDGAEAVEKAQEGGYQAILMDVHMPNLDGLDATRQIRLNEQEAGGHVPIIAVTASSVLGDPDKCFAAGMDYHLYKPVRKDDIARALEAVKAGDKGTTNPKNVEQRMVVDHEQFGMVMDLEDPECRALIEKFIDVVSCAIDEIDESSRAGNGEAVRQAAHKQKGSSATLGFDRLAGYFSLAEAAGRPNEVPLSDGWRDNAQSALAEALAAVGWPPS